MNFACRHKLQGGVHMIKLRSDFRAFFGTVARGHQQYADATQGGETWHRGRANRLTASGFGAVVGANPYCTPLQYLQGATYPSFTPNEACRYGTDHEDMACKQYVTEVRRANPAGNVEHFSSGLHVHPDCPFLGASPDGIVTAETASSSVPICYDCPLDRKYDIATYAFDPEAGGIVPCVTWTYPEGPHRYLLEIKCPFRKQLYGPIPPYYYAQIQGCMYILGLPYCHFYVWTPTRSSLVCYPFNERYWSSVMYPALHSMYFNQVLPLAFLRDEGLLKPQSLESICPITERAIREEAHELGVPYAACPPWINTGIIKAPALLEPMAAVPVAESGAALPESTSAVPESSSAVPME